MQGIGKNFSKNNTGKRKESDFYQTPYSITQQLLENEYFSPSECILEPACGLYAISDILEKNNLFVDTKDLIYGQNFLELEEKYKYDNIITNPPYSLAFEFIQKSKKIATKKIAMLLPLIYLHGQERLKHIWRDEEFPIARVHVFSRYPMLGGPMRNDGKYTTGMQVYAWFIWDKSHKGPANICWIDNQKYVISKKDLT